MRHDACCLHCHCSDQQADHQGAQRSATCLASVGVRLVWGINPGSQTVIAYASDGAIQHLVASQKLTGGTVLPGFEVDVSTLFPSKA